MISDYQKAMLDKSIARNYITNKLKKKKLKKNKSEGDLHAIRCLKIVLHYLRSEDDNWLDKHSLKQR